MHPIHDALQSLEEYVVLTGRPMSAYSEQVVEPQQRYYESHYARLLVNPLNHDHSKDQLREYLDLKRLCLN